MQKALLLISCLILASCSGVKSEAKYPTGADRAASADIYAKPETIFGNDGGLFKSSSKDDKDGGSGIGLESTQLGGERDILVGVNHIHTLSPRHRVLLEVCIYCVERAVGFLDAVVAARE